MKTALITGITGQDGSYLAELLLGKGYKVYGLVSQRAVPTTKNILHILDDIQIITGDLTDQASIDNAIKTTAPDEIYNLAAQSFVQSSWELPEYTSNVNGLGVLRILEGARKYAFGAKVYQASTSELFGKVQEIPQTEKTAFYPRSPYGIAKLFGYWSVVNYRESYGMFGCNGILFNHESPRRAEHFVTQKIAKSVVAIKKGLAKNLSLGNLEAKRDIGHAKDYVVAMWLMLQQENPQDFVIATGETHSVREMVEFCFGYVGLNWKDHVVFDERFVRKAEVDILIGNSEKARTVLGWNPVYKFEDILKEMVDYQLSVI
jgi:GDPmannose 4,6-dehydratase